MPDAGLACGPGEVLRGDVVALRPAREVQHDVDAVERGGESVAGDGVACDMLDAGLGRLRVPGQDSNVETGLAQQRDHPAADVPRAARHEQRCVHG